MATSFVHLRVHSEYSLVDGLIRVPTLIQQVTAQNMHAVALTDMSNLFALVKFYRAAIAAGIKPIMGADVWTAKTGTDPARMTLLCQNTAGYRNLMRLITRSYREGQKNGRPIIAYPWFSGHTEGLIALSGMDGDIGHALLSGQEPVAEHHLSQWQALFPDRFYIALSRIGHPHEKAYMDAATTLAVQANTPVVATNEVRFLHKTEFYAHEARVCIREGTVLGNPRRERRYTPQQYLRTPAEMAILFADMPEVLENSVEIARRCNLRPTLGKSFLPDFPVPADTTTATYFTQQAKNGLEQRLPTLLSNDPQHIAASRGPYDARLETEIDVILQMGFAGYFLIVADFVYWSKSQGIPVGPGRGSGAGSLVAYALGITNLDPLAYDLLFERFLNPERVSMPDFDIDFCMEGRDQVITHVAEKYGTHRVSQISTYGTMAAKAVVRDAGRVLDHPYKEVERISKLIPFEVGITLEKALEQEAELRKLYAQEEDVRNIIDLAKSLEGLARNVGRHAGGVVIAPTELTDFTALYCEEGQKDCATQFDKDDVEAVGLVKFDFLGLRTLTIIDWAVKTINQQRAQEGQVPIDIAQLPLTDAKTFQLLKRAETTAVFQLESQGMKELISRLLPDCFEDIIALVALFRPGPLQSGMVDDFIARKHGKQRIEYPHPSLASILRPTYGIILYQEQVMQIAQVLSGYSLGGADLLRRAMGKKDAEKMAKQRDGFVKGAQANGVDAVVASEIFDVIDKFAGYGFNKSHSAAYALLSYQTAWLKAHFPAAFMAAVLSSDMDKTDKLVISVEECRHMGIQLLRPCVNHSQYHFQVALHNSILYGLGGVKGVSQDVATSMVHARESGSFTDLFDFCQRVGTQYLTRRALEPLIYSGACDDLVPENDVLKKRALLVEQMDGALRQAQQSIKSSDQNDFFGQVTADMIVPVRPDPRLGNQEKDAWTPEKQARCEWEVLGFYLNSHPMDQYVSFFATLPVRPLAQLNKDVVEQVLTAGVITDVRLRNAQKGGQIALITVEDRHSRKVFRLSVECYEQYGHLITDQALLLLYGATGCDGYRKELRFSIEHVFNVDSALAAYVHRIDIKVTQAFCRAGNVEELSKIFKANPGYGCTVYIHYVQEKAEATLKLGNSWRLLPKVALFHALDALLGEGHVRFSTTPRPALSASVPAPIPSHVQQG